MYDDDGRLIRSVTVREPEFTTDDRVWLLGLMSYEAEIGPHGFLMSEAMDPANAHAFEADEMPTVDFVAKARGDAMDAYYKRWPDVSRNGHQFGVRRKPPEMTT